MSEELDTVNPTHLLMIDYVARLEKKLSELKLMNEKLKKENQELVDNLVISKYYYQLLTQLKQLKDGE